MKSQSVCIRVISLVLLVLMISVGMLYNIRPKNVAYGSDGFIFDGEISEGDLFVSGDELLPGFELKEVTASNDDPKLQGWGSCPEHPMDPDLRYCPDEDGDGDPEDHIQIFPWDPEGDGDFDGRWSYWVKFPRQLDGTYIDIDNDEEPGRDVAFLVGGEWVTTTVPVGGDNFIFEVPFSGAEEMRVRSSGSGGGILWVKPEEPTPTATNTPPPTATGSIWTPTATPTEPPTITPTPPPTGTPEPKRYLLYLPGVRAQEVEIILECKGIAHGLNNGDKVLQGEVLPSGVIVTESSQTLVVIDPNNPLSDPDLLVPGHEPGLAGMDPEDEYSDDPRGWFAIFESARGGFYRTWKGFDSDWEGTQTPSYVNGLKLPWLGDNTVYVSVFPEETTQVTVNTGESFMFWTEHCYEVAVPVD